MPNLRSLLRPRRALALLAGAWLASPACVIVADDDGRECTLIGCRGGLHPTFTSRSGAWAPGPYRIELDADGEAITCNVSLPLPPCSQSRAGECSSPDVVLGESGCNLPAEQHALTGLMFFFKQPASLGVKITRDGAAIADTRLTPNYTESWPNGRGCGPACRDATDDSVAIEVP